MNCATAKAFKVIYKGFLGPLKGGEFGLNGHFGYDLWYQAAGVMSYRDIHPFGPATLNLRSFPDASPSPEHRWQGIVPRQPDTAPSLLQVSLRLILLALERQLSFLSPLRLFLQQ